MSMPSVPTAITRPLRHGTDILRNTLGGWAWAPAVSMAKGAILTTLSCIETGTLILVDEPGETRHVFGQKLSAGVDQPPADGAYHRRASTTPRVEIVVKRDTFWMRLFLFADLGFSEAYMLGDFQCEDLTSFFQVSYPSQDSDICELW